MQLHITMVKEVANMAAAIKDTHPACNMRVACAIYRDYSDRKMQDDAGCDFTSDFDGIGSKFKLYLASIKAAGGSDFPEDIFTGLERVAQLGWQAQNRLLIHIGDAPCHGTQFHGGTCLGDTYPGGDKLGRNITDLLQKLHKHCKVSHYVFCHLTKFTQGMLEEFKRLMKEDAPENWIQEVSVERMGNIPEEVIAISRTTISSSSSTSALNTCHAKDRKVGTQLVVIPSMPKWNMISAQTGRQYRHKAYGSLDDLFMIIESRKPLAVEKMRALEIKIATNPFSAQGATRWPFHASIDDGAKNMVVKQFKASKGRGHEDFHDGKKYFWQMEVQTVSAHLASDFNDRIKDIGIANAKAVEFIPVTTLTVGLKVFNLEKYLEGKWIRYSNNMGYVNTEYADTLQAFTHWTHHRSNGLLMVTDLQGVVSRRDGVPINSDKYKFLLSDPAIHCRDVMRFTGTNFGTEGFNLFFRSHKCNDICKKLGLTNPAVTKKVPASC